MTQTICKSLSFYTALVLGVTAVPATAQVAGGGRASTSAADTKLQLDEIIVTAQRRSERLSDVPVAITALSSEQLTAKGIASPESLQRAVPGFTYTTSNFGTPTYNLRGVGTYDATLAAAPAVAVYVDETPLPFAAMTAAATLDLERIEVLKGPQGILYGQNSTGGAINYIAAKPQEEFGTGFNVSYGRFNRVTAEGYVTGALSETLKVRFAVRHEDGDGWQRSYTRNDELGSIERTFGRVLVDWDPTSSIRNHFSATGSIDRSETLAGQFIGIIAAVPGFVPPGILNYPVASKTPRAADWNPDTDWRRDNRFYQFANRLEIDVADEVTLLALTAYGHFDQDVPFDADGTRFRSAEYTDTGEIKVFNQELRLQGNTDRFKWVMGANYQRAKTEENVVGDIIDASNAFPAVILGFPELTSNFLQRQRQTTWAAFGDVDTAITENLGLDLGVRYTSFDAKMSGCIADTGDGYFAQTINFLLPVVPTTPGACLTLDSVTFAPGVVRQHLEEDNVSWRANLHWKVNPDTLLYASVTKGYKSGIFPNLGGLLSVQYNPATQERLLSYEAGFKSSLLDRKVQLNGSTFYYDYGDKQLRGRAVDPVFQTLEAILNIPKSRVIGGEIEATVRPVEGLTLSGSGAYLDSKVQGNYFNFDPYGNAVRFSGEPFPLTPKWQANGSVQYEHAVGAGLVGFGGASTNYRSTTEAAFQGGPVFRLNSNALLDLNVGLRAADGSWSIQLWGRNVTNKYYRNNVIRVADTIAAYAGEPATYGIAASMKLGSN